MYDDEQRDRLERLFGPLREPSDYLRVGAISLFVGLTIGAVIDIADLRNYELPITAAVLSAVILLCTYLVKPRKPK
jgi:hypothetical protein